MSVPAWYQNAIDDLGLMEGPGTADNPAVQALYSYTGLGPSRDSVPWCGAAMAKWMKKAGIDYDKNQAAAAIYWSTWGQPVKSKDIPIGAVGVKHRVGGNHVFMFAGWANKEKTIAKTIGGNQASGTGQNGKPIGKTDGAVTMSTVSVSEVIAWRWPKKIPLPIANQRYRHSAVIQGATATGASGIIVAAAEAPKLATALQDADSASSSGTILGALAAAIIIGAAVWIIVSRINAARAERKNSA
jgi:uncharacterized protein (TIGR02594 family)